MPLNYGAREDSWEYLWQQEIKSVNLKGHHPWILVGRTDAETETPVFWSSDANSWLIVSPQSWERWRAEEEGVRGWDGWCNGDELGQTSEDGEGQGGLACWGPWAGKESDMTGWLNRGLTDSDEIFLVTFTFHFFSVTVYMYLFYFSVLNTVRKLTESLEISKSITVCLSPGLGLIFYWLFYFATLYEHRLTCQFLPGRDANNTFLLEGVTSEVMGYFPVRH